MSSFRAEGVRDFRGDIHRDGADQGFRVLWSCVASQLGRSVRNGEESKMKPAVSAVAVSSSYPLRRHRRSGVVQGSLLRQPRSLQIYSGGTAEGCCSTFRNRRKCRMPLKRVDGASKVFLL